MQQHFPEGMPVRQQAMYASTTTIAVAGMVPTQTCAACNMHCIMDIHAT